VTRQLKVCALGGFAAFWSAWGCAVEAPLAVSNLSPFSMLRALPQQRTAQTHAGLQWELSGMVANHFILQSTDEDTLHLDGQTDRLTVSLRYGFARFWDIELKAPWIHHSGGFTDNAIERWHKAFGLPNGDRGFYPQNHLLYELREQGRVSNLERSTQGLGDIEVAVSRELTSSAGTYVAASIGVKSATGKAEDWLGSGTSDVFALLRFSGRYPEDGPLSWHGQVGVTRSGESPLLGENQRRTLGFAGLSLAWALTPQWSALLQYDAHSGVARGELASLEQAAGILSVALRWRPSQSWSIDVGFSEDVVVETAPDINFLLNFQFLPGP